MFTNHKFFVKSLVDKYEKNAQKWLIKIAVILFDFLVFGLDMKSKFIRPQQIFLLYFFQGMNE